MRVVLMLHGHWCDVMCGCVGGAAGRAGDVLGAVFGLPAEPDQPSASEIPPLHHHKAHSNRNTSCQVCCMGT